MTSTTAPSDAQVAGGSAPGTQPAPGPNAPKYPVLYAAPRAAEITAVLDRVHARLNAMPVCVVERQSRKEVTDFSKPAAIEMDRGPENKFNPISYPMGVIQNGMLNAAEVTGDARFSKYTAREFQFFADHIAAFAGWPTRTLEPPSTQPAEDAATQPSATAPAGTARAQGGGRGAPGGQGGMGNPFRVLLAPGSLDDCGAMTTAMIKARLANVGPDLKPIIDRAVDYVHTKQFRLADGTLARKRPVSDSLWADDMYMGVCILAQAGKMTGDVKYFDDAAKQVIQLSKYLYIPEKHLLTHGWNSMNPDFHPKYFWARANGWCMMAMAELLTVLPENHADRPAVLKAFRTLAEGIASVQGGDGLWHQMLDRTDSYTETSASAMFTFAFARGVDRGWLDAPSYGPVAQAGWNGVAPRVDKEGRVLGTCVGTSYANDYTYYYYRPNIDDIHGYGPVLLAGSELIRLQRNPRFRSLGGGGSNVTFSPRPGGNRGGATAPATP